MIYLLVHHEVADYQAWKAIFDSSLDWRTHNGERSCRIFRGVQNPNELTLLFEWESAEKARAFIGSAELKEKMVKAGVKTTPRIDYLTEMFSIRRSAAD
jgi:heme-degrading monooxygenase HmoA